MAEDEMRARSERAALPGHRTRPGERRSRTAGGAGCRPPRRCRCRTTPRRIATPPPDDPRLSSNRDWIGRTFVRIPSGPSSRTRRSRPAERGNRTPAEGRVPRAPGTAKRKIVANGDLPESRLPIDSRPASAVVSARGRRREDEVAAPARGRGGGGRRHPTRRGVGPEPPPPARGRPSLAHRPEPPVRKRPVPERAAACRDRGRGSSALALVHRIRRSRRGPDSPKRAEPRVSIRRGREADPLRRPSCFPP